MYYVPLIAVHSSGLSPILSRKSAPCPERMRQRAFQRKINVVPSMLNRETEQGEWHRGGGINNLTFKGGVLLDGPRNTAHSQKRDENAPTQAAPLAHTNTPL